MHDHGVAEVAAAADVDDHDESVSNCSSETASEDLR
jgi:hypothetical protein